MEEDAAERNRRLEDQIIEERARWWARTLELWLEKKENRALIRILLVEAFDAWEAAKREKFFGSLGRWTFWGLVASAAAFFGWKKWGG